MIESEREIVTGDTYFFFRLYVQKKYESELWFQQKAASQCFSTKDVLKLLVIKPLQTLLVNFSFILYLDVLKNFYLLTKICYCVSIMHANILEVINSFLQHVDFRLKEYRWGRAIKAASQKESCCVSVRVYIYIIFFFLSSSMLKSLTNFLNHCRV